METEEIADVCCRQCLAPYRREQDFITNDLVWVQPKECDHLFGDILVNGIEPTTGDE